jgi:hypothetical protein
MSVLRLLVTLKLDPAKIRLISKFVDTYLRLNTKEEKTFLGELDKIEATQKDAIMQVTTSWEEKGIETGQRSLVSLQLEQKVGNCLLILAISFLPLLLKDCRLWRSLSSTSVRWRSISLGESMI